MPVSAKLDNLRVVLVSARNPLNIGAAARALSNFGFTHLRLVNPYEVAFREARSAVGAAALLQTAREYHTLREAVADCTLVVGATAVGHRELRQPLRRLEYGARLICRRLASGPVALLFGSEKFGLEPGLEPLPLADAHPHLRRARVHEPGTGRRRLPL